MKPTAYHFQRYRNLNARAFSKEMNAMLKDDWEVHSIVNMGNGVVAVLYVQFMDQGFKKMPKPRVLYTSPEGYKPGYQ